MIAGPFGMERAQPSLLDRNAAPVQLRLGAIPIGLLQVAAKLPGGPEMLVTLDIRVATNPVLRRRFANQEVSRCLGGQRPSSKQPADAAVRRSST